MRGAENQAKWRGASASRNPADVVHVRPRSDRGCMRHAAANMDEAALAESPESFFHCGCRTRCFEAWGGDRAANKRDSSTHFLWSAPLSTNGPDEKMGVERRRRKRGASKQKRPEEGKSARLGRENVDHSKENTRNESRVLSPADSAATSAYSP
ncbi:hypothetical protein MRX96_006492 [Rhipicephalus microplus]